MSTLNKGAFYLVSFIIGVYYGILPLFGLEVYIRNTGWIQMDFKQSMINTLIGISIFIYVNRYKK